MDVSQQNFDFDLIYVKCLNTTFHATTKVLENVQNFRFTLTATNSGKYVKKNVLKTCHELIKTIMEKSYPEWDKLYSRSFDADQQTLFHIQFWINYLQCLVAILQYFAVKTIPYVTFFFQ